MTELAYSSEQLEVQELLRRFFSEQWPIAEARSFYAGKKPTTNKLFKDFLDLGIFDLVSSGDLGARLLCIVAQISGQVLLPFPASNFLLAGPYLSSLNALAKLPEVERAGLATGSKLAIFAAQIELANAPDTLRTTVTQESLPAFLVYAKPGSEALNIQSLSEQSLVSQKPLSSIDYTSERQALEFKVLAPQPVEKAGYQELSNLLDLLCAHEILGCLERVVSLTREYIITREQFGVPVGGFQAVQHKMVDMFLHTEALSALCEFASWAQDHSPAQSKLASLAALRHANLHAQEIVETAIQVHGGIGFTWEYELHLYLRRIIFLKHQRPWQMGDNDTLIRFGL